jgi:hypothetical protein
MFCPSSSFSRIRVSFGHQDIAIMFLLSRLVYIGNSSCLLGLGCLFCLFWHSILSWIFTLLCWKDGSKIQLKSTTLQTYACAEGGGGQNVVVNRTPASGWETFKVYITGEKPFFYDHFSIRISCFCSALSYWKHFIFSSSLVYGGRAHLI